jgi:hypothetical protein
VRRRGPALAVRETGPRAVHPKGGKVMSIATNLVSRDIAPRHNLLEVKIIAVSTVASVSTNSAGWISVDVDEDDLPEGGVVFVGTWQIVGRPEEVNFFAFHVTGTTSGEFKTVSPNKHWRFVENGNGELTSISDQRYIVHPGEIGYWDCFTSSDFSLANHSFLLLREAGATDDEFQLSVSMLTGSRESGVYLVKSLAYSLLASQALVAQLQADIAERDQRLLEVMAWLESLMSPSDTNPLGPLVRSKTPEVAGLAKQVAGHVDQATLATGVDLGKYFRGGKSSGGRIDVELPGTCHLMYMFRPDLIPPHRDNVPAT